MDPKVAIVILNWNGKKYLEQFLPSVIASSYGNLEIVLVDNGSSDDSIAYVQQHFPKIRIITLSENLGFSKGYNAALKQIQADYFVLLNSDVEVEKNWIRPVIELMKNDPSIAVCQPKIRMFNHREMFEYAGAAGGWLDYLGYPFARGRIFDICEKDSGQYDTNMPIFWASGAAMFVKAPVYHELNGLDEFFFAHQEEIDFCWRVQLAGYKIFACCDSVVYHVGGGTLPKGNERKVFLNFRNNLIMMAKNLPSWQSVIKIPFRFILDNISGIKSLFEGEGVYYKAIIRAHFAFLKWLLKKKNKSYFPNYRSTDLCGLYKGSVVWKHFIRGKTKFSEIVEHK